MLRFTTNLITAQSKPVSERRFIHCPLYFTKENTRRLVIIGHNSMLFGALGSLKYYGHEKYPQITYIYPSFWLDKVHKDYDDLDWGQTIYGLPKTVRDIFLQYRPHYPEEKYIKWHEFQELRKFACKELAENFNVEFHEKDPRMIESRADNWFIDFGNDGITVPQESFFYCWYRKPYLPSGMEMVEPHTQLYTLPRSLVPNPMIIIGHGLSVVWLLKHFPNHKIINVKMPGETLPEIPANAGISIKDEIKKGRLIIYTTDKVRLRADSSWKKGTVFSAETGKRLCEDDLAIFAATGIMPEHKILEEIPEDKKVLLPVFKDDKLVAPLDSRTKELVKDTFKAPKNLPLGSLPQSYTYLMNLTNNMSWTAEPMFYYRLSQYELLKKETQKVGIELRLDYFDALDKAIEELDNPLNSQQAEKLYLDVFKNVYNPTGIEVTAFRQSLQSLFKFEIDKDFSEGRKFNLKGST